MSDTELLAAVYWRVCDWTRAHPHRTRLDRATVLELQVSVLAAVDARQRMRAVRVLREHVHGARGGVCRNLAR